MLLLIIKNYLNSCLGSGIWDLGSGMGFLSFCLLLIKNFINKCGW